MDFLLYMCALKGIPTEQGKKRALELLGIVNLLDAKDKKIGTLSGGMRQRVGIVQAMLSDPKILILDEPTAGLDPSERIRFRNLISQFAQGRTILLATHIVSDVECIAKEIIILKEGTLITQGTTDTLEQSIYTPTEKSSPRGLDLDGIRSTLNSLIDFSGSTISHDVVNQFVYMVTPTSDTTFDWYVNLNGTADVKATFTAEGRKKSCIIKLEEIEKISSLHRKENEDNAHLIKNPIVFTFLHRLLSRMPGKRFSEIVSRLPKLAGGFFG